MIRILAILGFLLVFTQIQAQDLAVLSQREQAKVIDSWLDDRINNLLPTLMT
jgi:hypothetical protein